MGSSSTTPHTSRYKTLFVRPKMCFLFDRLGSNDHLGLLLLYQPPCSIVTSLPTSSGPQVFWCCHSLKGGWSLGLAHSTVYPRQLIDSCGFQTEFGFVPNGLLHGPIEVLWLPGMAEQLGLWIRSHYAASPFMGFLQLHLVYWKAT